MPPKAELDKVGLSARLGEIWSNQSLNTLIDLRSTLEAARVPIEKFVEQVNDDVGIPVFSLDQRGRLRVDTGIKHFVSVEMIQWVGENLHPQTKWERIPWTTFRGFAVIEHRDWCRIWRRGGDNPEPEEMQGCNGLVHLSYRYDAVYSGSGKREVIYAYDRGVERPSPCDGTCRGRPIHGWFLAKVDLDTVLQKI